MSPAEKDAVEAFRRDVVEPSMTKLVIIDFWAEWCGPCKALTPTLEKVAADYADKGVVLAKVDTDKNQFIAAQFQIKSIPTVYAMFQGQLVADMTSARTESQLRVILDQLLKQLPIESEAADAVAEIEPLIAMGEEALAEGDGERALGIFRQIAEIAPEHPQVHAGFVRALVATGQLDEATDWLANLDPAIAKDPAIHRAQAALALAQSAPRSRICRHCWPRSRRTTTTWMPGSRSPTARWRRTTAMPRPTPSSASSPPSETGTRAPRGPSC